MQEKFTQPRDTQPSDPRFEVNSLSEQKRRHVQSGGKMSEFVPQRPGRHPNSQKFHDLLDTIGKLHDRKQAGYGKPGDPFANVRAAEEWGVDGWLGAMIRLSDKVRRLQSVSARRIPDKAVDDSVRDNLMDIAVYALISLVLYEESNSENNPSY